MHGRLMPFLVADVLPSPLKLPGGSRWYPAARAMLALPSDISPAAAMAMVVFMGSSFLHLAPSKCFADPDSVEPRIGHEDIGCQCRVIAVQEGAGDCGRVEQVLD